MKLRFDLTMGFAIAVVVLAMLLGFSIGHNKRPTDADALAAKQAAYVAGVKRGKVNATPDGFNAGLSAGMIKGARVGKKRGEAAAALTGPTGVTGSTGVASVTSATGATGQ